MNPIHRYELTDDQWDRLKAYLPPQHPATGRPAKDHRTMLNAMLWIDRTGAPWRDLPDRYGKWQTVYSRFRRWREAGVWDRILTALQREAAFDDDLDGSLAMIDGTNIRAHPQAAGAKKGARNPTSVAAGAAGGASSTW
jgi:transposase